MRGFDAATALSMAQRWHRYAATDQWRCPDNRDGAHYWELDGAGHGRCRHCGEERQHSQGHKPNLNNTVPELVTVPRPRQEVSAHHLRETTKMVRKPKCADPVDCYECQHCEAVKRRLRCAAGHFSDIATKGQATVDLLRERHGDCEDYQQRTTKHCGECGHDKPLSRYQPDLSARDGYKSYCMDCYNRRDARRREKNRETREQAEARRERDTAVVRGLR